MANAGFAAKKKSVHAAERDTDWVKELRRAFLEALPGEDVARFKFIDEMRSKPLGRVHSTLAFLEVFDNKRLVKQANPTGPALVGPVGWGWPWRGG